MEPPFLPTDVMEAPHSQPAVALPVCGHEAYRVQQPQHWSPPEAPTCSQVSVMTGLEPQQPSCLYMDMCIQNTDWLNKYVGGGIK